MDYQVSARKYRPGAFHDVIGQGHVVQTLVNAITTKRIAHAFLFSGTRGVGKTTVARILAKALNCEQGPTGTPCETCANCQEITLGTSVDVVEIDGASNTGVDDVREIRENVKFTPFRGGYRVYIIDEVHMLSNSAFNALLKTLEEPPAHVVFIFATTEIHKIPPTILSRCQHFNFRRISAADIVARLRHVADQDGLTVEDRSLALLARASEGSMRDALSLLDQAIAFGGKTIRHADLESLLGSVPQEQIRACIAAIIAQDSPAALRVIAQLLECGHDLRAYCGELVEYVRHLLVASVVAVSPDARGLHSLRGLIDLPEDDLRQIVADSKSLTADQLQELFRMLSQAEDAVRLSPRPRFVLEAAVVRATRLLKTSAAEPPVAVGRTKEAPPPTPPPAVRRSEAGSPAKPSPTASPTAGRSPVAEARPVASASTPGTRRSADPSPVSSGSPAAPSPSSGPVSRLDPAPTTTAGQARDEAVGERSTVPHPKVDLVWEQVVELVERRHPNIGPFLAMGALLPIEDHQVTIGFPKTASIALARIQKDETLQLVAGICAELAGRPVRLKAVELLDGQPAPPSLAQQRASRMHTHKHSLLEQARAHPLVKHALEIFGGDLVEVRPASPQEETR